MKYGCARNTDDQTTAVQLAALKTSPAFQHLRGQGTIGSPGKAPCTLPLGTLRAADTLIVWKLDRLGRSPRDLITMLDDLRAQA